MRSSGGKLWRKSADWTSGFPQLEGKILTWGSGSGRSVHLLMRLLHKHFIPLNHICVRLCIALYATDEAIACLRRVTRPIWHHIRLFHNFPLSSIGYWPVCNFSLSGGDTIQPGLLETGQCHHPSLPGRGRPSRSFRHRRNSLHCRLHQRWRCSLMVTTFLRAERRRLGKKLPTWDPLQLDTSAATSHRAGGRLPVSGYHGRSLSKSQKGMSTRSWRCLRRG